MTNLINTDGLLNALHNNSTTIIKTILIYLILFFLAVRGRAYVMTLVRKLNLNPTLTNNLIVSIKDVSIYFQKILFLFIIKTILSITFPDFIQTINKYLNVGFTAAFAVLLYKIKKTYIGYLINQQKDNPEKAINPTLIYLLNKFLSVGIVLVAIGSSLSVFGVDLTYLLGIGGAGSLILGLALKDIIGNFFSAIMIHLDPQFKVGDRINIPSESIDGVVEAITLRQTLVRDLDKKLIYIPNALITSVSVINLSSITHRRIHERLTLEYNDWSKITAIIESIKALLRQDASIDTTQTCTVHFETYANYSIDISIVAYSKKTNYLEFIEQRQQLLLSIGDIIHHHKANFAFPTVVNKIENTPK